MSAASYLRAKREFANHAMRVIALGLISACTLLATFTATGAISMFGQPSPLKAGDYFTGRKLEIATAIKAGDMEQVRLLADGVDLSAPGKKGMTLLWFAMDPTEPSYEGVKTLVSLGVDPEEQSAKGIGTAFYYTLLPRESWRKDSGPKLLEAMLEGGMSPNMVTDKDNTTILMRAASGVNTLEQVKILLQHGADINARDSIGNTPLYEAETAVNLEIARYLIAQGADVNAHTRLGVSVAWSVKLSIDHSQSDAERQAYEGLRDLLVSNGAKWPPDPPEVVREQMRARGEEPIIPAGKQR